jgi:hypothetical protein
VRPFYNTINGLKNRLRVVWQAPFRESPAR